MIMQHCGHLERTRSAPRGRTAADGADIPPGHSTGLDLYQARKSSGGPRPAINCFHTYPPPYTFFHLPSSTLICFHHFSTFLSVHLIHFFIIIFPKFSPSFSPFSSPHSFHHIPLKISFPQSPRLIHFKKINFAKYIAKNICHQKNIRTV